MVTIDDIAKIAGVSNTTVSNVIHGRANRVSPDTLEKINRIIEELGYAPNMSARALASRSSKMVAVISLLDPEKSGGFMEDPFHYILISAMEQALRESGYYLMLRAVAGADDLKSFLHNWSVDGLFLTGLFEDDELCPVLAELDIPVVLADSYLSNYGNMAHVGLQDLRGGYIATEYLLQNNHRSIAFACPPIRKNGVVEQRLLGYQQALKSYGIPFLSSLVFECEFSTTGTMRLGEQLGSLEGVTAVFATADIMASGIMAGLQQSGKSVPGDFSVIGFDDIEWCRMTSPTLTTVRQDAKRRGQLAAQFMVELLESRALPERNIILPVSLQIRESVKKL